MNTLKIFWNALRAGETLTDPTKWKDRQNTVNALSAVVGLLVILIGKTTGMELALSGDEVAGISAGVAIVLGVINKYLTTATTKKIGFEKSEEKIQGD